MAAIMEEGTYQSNSSPDKADKSDEIHDIEVERKFQSSLSPEYKSSWNEINIQGDYDQYARSAAPSRRLQSDSVSLKKENSSSPRSKENGQTSECQSPKTKPSRVKLSKTGSRPVRSNPTLSPAEFETGERTKMLNTSKSEPTDEFTNSKSTLMTMKQKESNDTSNLSSMLNDTLKSIESNQNDSIRKNEHFEEEKFQQQQPNHWSRTSNKSSKEFLPPVVTAVDFHEPRMSQAVKFATRNGLLVEGSDQWHESRKTHNGNISRLSAMFMANYLGVGYDQSPNVVTSIVVKPILPPLSLKKPRVRRRVTSKKSSPEEVEFQILPEKKQAEIDNKDSTDSSKLPPLRDANVYKWKHSEFVSKLNNDEHRRRIDAKQTPYRLQPREEDTETIFEHIVRWRSKVRHCGKPAMYRRITSPTLGEVALRRKLTDRLPTPQSSHNRPNAKDLHPQGGIESWRRPRSRIDADPTVKQFIRQKLKNVQKDATSPNVIEGFYDVTMNMKQTSLRQRLEERNHKKEVMKIPLPDLSLRRRQPVWQRMR